MSPVDNKTMTQTAQKQQNIPKGWQKKQIKDLLDYERPDKYIVKNDRYIDVGVPVLTANKSFVLGYTDETDGIFNDLPVIVFDDFTTDSKFVDFPFKIKSSAIKILRGKEGADLRFVFEKMRSINFPRGAHKRYYISQYQNMEVLVPPLPEQKRIAEILGAVDEEIQKTDEIIAATERLKRGLASHFFNRKVEKTVPLGDYVEIRSGDTPSGFVFEESGAYPFYKVEDMNQSQKYLVPTRFYFNKYDRPLMPKGMVVFPKRGAAIHTNKVRILSTDSYFDTNVMGLVTKKGLNNEYLYYLLTHIGLAQFADTTSVAQINNKHIEPLEIPLPVVHEQQKIAEILSSIDEKNSVNQKLKEKLTLLKKGLMQDLLTGKKRTI